MQTLGDVRTVVLSRIPDVNDRVPLLINELLSLFSIDILYPCGTRYSGSLCVRERGSCPMIALNAFQMHTAPPTDVKKPLVGLSRSLPSCHHHISSIHVEIIYTFWGRVGTDAITAPKVSNQSSRIDGGRLSRRFGDGLEYLLICTGIYSKRHGSKLVPIQFGSLKWQERIGELTQMPFQHRHVERDDAGMARDI